MTSNTPHFIELILLYRFFPKRQGTPAVAEVPYQGYVCLASFVVVRQNPVLVIHPTVVQHIAIRGIAIPIPCVVAGDGIFHIIDAFLNHIARLTENAALVVVGIIFSVVAVGLSVAACTVSTLTVTGCAVASCTVSVLSVTGRAIASCTVSGLPVIGHAIVGCGIAVLCRTGIFRATSAGCQTEHHEQGGQQECQCPFHRRFLLLQGLVVCDTQLLLSPDLRFGLKEIFVQSGKRLPNVHIIDFSECCHWNDSQKLCELCIM